MHSFYFNNILTVLYLLLISAAYGQGPVVKGIYGSPEPFWERNLVLSDLGINAVFVHSGSIDSSMVNRLKGEGLKIYAEFPTLNGKDYVKDNPDAWPIDKNGEKSPQASWFLGVCPTNMEFRQFRMQQLKKLLQSFPLDGIWMDYVHWHAQFEEPDPILPETCFCNSCLEEFKAFNGIGIPGNSTAEKADWILTHADSSWRNWRCNVIRSWAVEIKNILKTENPGALLGIYHCPWEDNEFDGARRRILGIDYDVLRDVVDVFSPMLYHGRMGRDPGWVNENLMWFYDRLNIKPEIKPEVWPIVQAYDDPEPIQPADFALVLQDGLQPPSGGIMMFTSHAVANDPEKVRIMKRIYNQPGR